MHGKPIFSSRQVTKNAQKIGPGFDPTGDPRVHTIGPLPCTAMYFRFSDGCRNFPREILCAIRAISCALDRQLPFVFCREVLVRDQSFCHCVSQTNFLCIRCVSRGLRFTAPWMALLRQPTAAPGRFLIQQSLSTKHSAARLKSPGQCQSKVHIRRSRGAALQQSNTSAPDCCPRGCGSVHVRCC